MQILKYGKQNKGGFTLIELTVVILIIGLIVSIVYPHIEITTPRKKLRITANRFAGIIKYVHNKAAITKQIYRLNYDISEGEFWITRLKRNEMLFIPDSSLISYKSKLKKGIFFKDIVKKKGKAIDGEAFTQFLPDGRAENTTIHMGDKDQNIYTIFIKPLSGGVNISDKYIEILEY